jgi:hypothetical protein
LKFGICSRAWIASSLRSEAAFGEGFTKKAITLPTQGACFFIAPKPKPASLVRIKKATN